MSNHGAKGGDWFGEVKSAENYGWKILGWGGKNYSGSKIGDGEPFKEKFDKPLISWVPSIAPSNIKFYDKDMFHNLKNSFLYFWKFHRFF